MICKECRNGSTGILEYKGRTGVTITKGGRWTTYSRSDQYITRSKNFFFICQSLTQNLTFHTTHAHTTLLLHNNLSRRKTTDEMLQQIIERWIHNLYFSSCMNVLLLSLTCTLVALGSTRPSLSVLEDPYFFFFSRGVSSRSVAALCSF